MHARRVVPEKERLSTFHGLVHEIERDLKHVFFDRFHPLAREGTGVLANLLAHASEPRVFGGIVYVGGLAIEQAAGAEHCNELRILRVIRFFRFLLGVHLVEVAVEFTEAVYSRQEFVAVAEVVLANLSGGVSERLQ